MSTIFTRIIEGEIPCRMIWEDQVCVAFLDARPLSPGHCLVVPRVEIDHWTDLDPELAAHVTMVAQAVGRAQQAVFNPSRVGMMVAGFEVPHVHVHVFPADDMTAFDFKQAETSPDAAVLDKHLDQLRAALTEAGHHEVSAR